MTDSRFKKIVPDGELECIWVSAGGVPYKLCPYKYDCDHCPFYKSMTEGTLTEQDTNRFKDYKFGSDVYYDKNHVWFKPEKHGLIRIGLDDFAQSIIGKIEEISVPEPGQNLAHQKIVLATEKTVVALPFLSDATVVDVNAHLNKSADLINDYPFTAGWIALIKSRDVLSHQTTLYSGVPALEWFKNDVEQLTQFFHESVANPELMQDGGRPSSEFFKSLPQKKIKQLHKMFLGV